MAGANAAAFTSLTPLLRSSDATRNPPAVLASAPTSRATRRKNYLRPKILKTLTKPYSPTTHTQSPLVPEVPVSSPGPQPDREFAFEGPAGDVSCERLPAVVRDGDGEAEELSVSERVGSAHEYGGLAGKFSAKSLLKYGAYAFLAFVFQTILAVAVLGNADPEENRGQKSRRSGSGVGEASDRRQFFSTGNESFFGGNLEGKIEEIRAMAREARRKEKKASEYGVEGDDEGDSEHVMSKSRIGIEKEVNARLDKLQKRLNSATGRPSGSAINFLKKSREIEGIEKLGKSSLVEVNETLMFKKRFRFKSPSIDTRSKPKGFKGSKDSSVSERKEDAPGTVGPISIDGTACNDDEQLDQERQESIDINETLETEKENDGRKEAFELKLVQHDGEPLEKGIEKRNLGKQKNGIVQEMSESTDEVVQRRKSRTAGRKNSQRVSGKKISQSFRTGEQVMKPVKQPSSTRDESIEDREVGNRGVFDRANNKQLDSRTDLWWLNLPYVLAILMSKGSDDEKLGGLYTLKFNPEEQESVISYTVTFEDRGDANNFCFLLESFFEDLDDFRADVIPFSRKELHEAVASRSMRIIVVRKGQLQLYAGQPLADVEMALRSLVN